MNRGSFVKLNQKAAMEVPDISHLAFHVVKARTVKGCSLPSCLRIIIPPDLHATCLNGIHPLCLDHMEPKELT